MTDRPILFSAPMVRALLAGRKTQTRRPLEVKFGFKPWQDESDGSWFQSGYREAGDDRLAIRFAPGDRLWVREAWSGPYEMTGIPPRDWLPTHVWYWADGNPADGDWTRPKPGIHMPRWASRITLAVTDVRVERLQDISEADTIAEGVDPLSSELEKYEASIGIAGATDYSRETRTFRPAFQRLWGSIHGTGAWDANPWVAAISFTVERRNIDAAAPGVRP